MLSGRRPIVMSGLELECRRDGLRFSFGQSFSCARNLFRYGIYDIFNRTPENAQLFSMSRILLVSYGLSTPENSRIRAMHNAYLLA